MKRSEMKRKEEKKVIIANEHKDHEAGRQLSNCITTDISCCNRKFLS